MNYYSKHGLVFLSAPYRSNPIDTTNRMRTIQAFLKLEFPELDFFVPHMHSDKWKADACLRKDPRPMEAMAMTNCIINLSRCTEIWLCGPSEISMGMRAEIAYAKAVQIPIVQRQYLWEKAVSDDFIKMSQAEQFTEAETKPELPYLLLEQVG